MKRNRIKYIFFKIKMMIKFFFDAMYYQFFIYNRDKFRLEEPHDRTIMLFSSLLFLPTMVFFYLLLKENFDYSTQFIFFIAMYYAIHYLLDKYYVKKKRGIEIIRQKPLLLNSQRFSFFISWMVYPILAILLYYIIRYKSWLKFL